MTDLIKAFTLIELLVVVLIIGILAAVAVPQYQKAVLKARYTQAMVLARNFAEAEVRYYLANGAFTEKFTELDIEVPGFLTLNTNGTFAKGNDYLLWTWFSATGTSGSGVVAVSYPGVQYLQNIGSQKGLGNRQCRALTTNTQANEFCKSLGGTYIDTYDNYAAYHLP